MPYPWATPPEVLDAVSRRVQAAGGAGDLEPFWAATAAESLARAAAVVWAILSGRGFGPLSIAGWPALPGYVRLLAVYFTFEAEGLAPGGTRPRSAGSTCGTSCGGSGAE